MKVLASFCNVPLNTDFTNNNFSPLVLIDLSTSKITWITLPLDDNFLGLTGLCHHQDQVLVLSQQKDYSTLYFLDQKTLSLQSTQKLTEIKDPHSLVSDDKHVYIVSSGNDSIIKYTCHNNHLSHPNVYYSKDKQHKSQDNHHLNSITISPEGILISGFGKKTGELHRTARNGYVLNLTQKKRLYSHIYHPHSILHHLGDTYYCESGKSTVSKNGVPILTFQEGYTRGLLITKDQIIVGTSIPRNVSKSTGKQIDNDPTNKNCCRVVQVKSSFFGRQVRVFNFSSRFQEIYDIIEARGCEILPTIKFDTNSHSKIFK